MDPNLSTVRMRRAELAKQRSALEDEDKELEIAERALQRLAASSSTIGPARPQKSGAPKGPISQIDLVLATLRVNADPWVESPAALRQKIQQTHGVDIKRTSLQPLISHLKKDGVLVRDELRIALAERVSGNAQTNRATES